jgi:predicted metalloprotease
MKWENRGLSKNVEDRRARRAGGAGVPLGVGGTLLLLALSLFLGTDLFSLLGVSSPLGAAAASWSVPGAEASDDERVHFMSAVLDESQAMWAAIFAENDLVYEDAVLVLYEGAITSGCGYAPASSGPFYCPLDGRVYLDLAFYDVLRDRYGAAGDFAQAYVLAHEVGHHVQNLLGTAAKVRQLQRAEPRYANRLSVALELQADCYAGVYGRSVAERGGLERGDLEEGLSAAAAVGDDRLQRQATGQVNTETFTHGSSAQRMRWFGRGFETGDPSACDTFSGVDL